MSFLAGFLCGFGLAGGVACLLHQVTKEARR